MSKVVPKHDGFDEIAPLAKHCSKCERIKPAGDFHRARRQRDALQPWCKACRRAHAQATYDPEKQRQYRIENGETIKARKKSYLQQNREKEQARIQRWARANPEKARAIKRRYAEKFGDRDRHRLQQFIARNPDRKNMGRRQLRAKYVAWVMTRRCQHLEPTDIPAALIAAKQQQLMILRELRSTA